MCLSSKKQNMKIAVLALQGAFIEHQQMLERLGVESVQIRQLSDWNSYVAEAKAAGTSCALIIPGGESTTMLRLLNDLSLFSPIREAIVGGMPVFGTCAGLIMLDDQHLGTMRIHALRNAYGRQLGSFHTESTFADVQIPMTFIRAPYIQEADEGVEILSVVDGRMVAARQQNQLVTAFHPELDESTIVHEYFCRMVENGGL